MQTDGFICLGKNSALKSMQTGKATLCKEMARQCQSTDLHATYRDTKGTSVPTPDTHHQQSLRTGGTNRWSAYPVKSHVTGEHNFVRR